MTTETDDAKVARLRELLPATSAGIYLDTAEFGPLPAETAAAMREADDWELKVGRATVGRDEDMEQRVEEARAVLAALLVADPSDVFLTAGVREAVRLGTVACPQGHTYSIDASHIVGALSPDGLTHDFPIVAFTCDKWLLGPEQTAAVWIDPVVRRPGLKLPPSSGLSRTAVLGLARSVGWLEMYVGLEWIYERTRRLIVLLGESLAEIKGVTSHFNPEADAVVYFQVDRWSGEDVVDELRRRVFAIVGLDWHLHSIRASVGWFNTESEIDTFVGAVREIAASTPDSIPRRLPLLGQ